MKEKHSLEDFRFPNWNYPHYFKQVFSKYGLRAFDKQFRRHILRPFSRSLIKKYAPRGLGLEVGVGAQTIAPAKRTILADFFEEHARSRSCAQVFFSGDEIPFDSESFSFVLSEHMLEHTANPIKYLLEWQRVLKPGGKLFLFLPHKERTFDRLRPRTTLNHLLQDYEKSTAEDDKTHLKEWMSLVIDRGFANHYASIPAEDMAKKGCLHHHVWITDDITELLKHLGFKILFSCDCVPDRDDSFAVVAEKIKSGDK